MKCAFICSDTNKVVAHRRQHSKLEYIRLAGFRKVANNEPCLTTEQELAASSAESSGAGISIVQQQQQQQQPASPASSSTTGSTTPVVQTGSASSGPAGTTGNLVECNYSLKQTHYHCLVCNCSVLSRAQLSSHRHRV